MDLSGHFAGKVSDVREADGLRRIAVSFCGPTRFSKFYRNAVTFCFFKDLHDVV